MTGTVSAVSLAGRQIGRPASRLTNGRVRTVTVGVGKTVNADVGFFDADAIPRSHCRPVLAAGLRVFAPNTSTAKFVPFPSTVCSRGGSLRIGASRGNSEHTGASARARRPHRPS